MPATELVILLVVAALLALVLLALFFGARSGARLAGRRESR